MYSNFCNKQWAITCSQHSPTYIDKWLETFNQFGSHTYAVIILIIHNYYHEYIQ